MMATIASKPRIVTHSGAFHADEALGCFMLKCLPEFKSAEIVRSRDPKVLETATIVLDVGAEYDVSRMKFDHHQREFQDTFSPEFKTRLSSAGLIYKHFGPKVIQSIIPQVTLSQEQLDLLHEKIYEELIEAFDAIDNGIDRFPKGTELAYHDNTSVSSIVSRLNPMPHETEVDEMNCFEKAMEVCGHHFVRTVYYYGLNWLPARDVIIQALQQAQNQVLVLDGFFPWKDHLFSLEEKMNVTQNQQILYVVFPDKSGSWRVQAVAKARGSFENRKSLPQPWCGLRDEVLDNVTGVPGGIFVHATGFIGGHQTKEGALKLAELAVKYS